MNSVAGTTNNLDWLSEPSGTSTGPFLDYHTVFAADSMSASRFGRCHVQQRRPVHLRGFCANWQACKTWSPAHLAGKAPALAVPLKEYGSNGRIDTSVRPLADYAALLAQDEHTDATAGGRVMPPYCHDIPLFSMIEGLVNDCCPFPVDFLPTFYRPNWWRFAQFFIGPKGSLTPMHFDTLMTHNMFFQIAGRKRFTIVPAAQAHLCGRQGWRWFGLDPENIDTAKYPAFASVRPIEIVVGPGDMLYLPPGTLHHVRSLDASISFNIDYHTARSVVRALRAVTGGMPRQNIFYNTILSLGLILGIPQAVLFPLYRSYLNYVS
jgi:hypothetical protein